MSRVVIVARTRMQRGHVCIGGHDLDRNFRAVRLLDRFGNHWGSVSPFAVGEVWDMRYREKGGAPPHVEDVKVERYRGLQPVVDLPGLVLKNVGPWTGAADSLFDGTVRNTSSGTAYIPIRGPLPGCSTGYWVPDQELVRDMSRERARFALAGQSAIRQFAWVGVQDPPERIEAGSLVRVSLSRAFGSSTAPDGYYVQLSGVLGPSNGVLDTAETGVDTYDAGLEGVTSASSAAGVQRLLSRLLSKNR